MKVKYEEIGDHVASYLHKHLIPSRLSLQDFVAGSVGYYTFTWPHPRIVGKMGEYTRATVRIACQQKGFFRVYPAEAESQVALDMLEELIRKEITP